jgi:thiol:disulfide interchange protein
VVLVRFDVTDQTDEHEALQERYGANTLPTLIGLSPAGAEVLRITDLLDPEGFVAALARLE